MMNSDGVHWLTLRWVKWLCCHHSRMNLRVCHHWITLLSWHHVRVGLLLTVLIDGRHLLSGMNLLSVSCCILIHRRRRSKVKRWRIAG